MAVLTPPEVRTGGSWERVSRPLLAGATVAAATLALRLRDPHRGGSWGYCPFKLLTGLDCPGCGCLRAVNDLTHGDLVAAASSNLLFVVAVPFVVAGWALWVRRAWTGAPRSPGAVARRVGSPGAVVVLVAVVAVFAVLRNTGWGAWLHS